MQKYLQVKKIELSKQGKNKGKYFALVSDEDYERVNNINWFVRFKRGKPRAHGRIKEEKKEVKMHRFIMRVTNPKIQVDHKDLDGLNNQKYNLRTCTNAENSRNKDGYGGTSKYKGVCWDKDRYKWRASIGYNNIKIRLGRFANEIEAAIAYNHAAIKYHGEFARLNVIPK